MIKLGRAELCWNFSCLLKDFPDIHRFSTVHMEIYYSVISESSWGMVKPSQNFLISSKKAEFTELRAALYSGTFHSISCICGGLCNCNWLSSLSAKLQHTLVNDAIIKRKLYKVSCFKENPALCYLLSPYAFFFHAQVLESMCTTRLSTWNPLFLRLLLICICRMKYENHWNVMSINCLFVLMSVPHALFCTKS